MNELAFRGGRKSSNPRTLLLTSTRPGIGSVGEIFLASLCKLFLPGELFCFAAVSLAYEIPIEDEELSWLPVTARQLPPEYHWQYQKTLASRFAHKIRHIELLEKSLRSFLEEALIIIANNNIELLWLVLNSPSMLLIAQKILALTEIPAMAIVWDPMSSISEQGKMDARSRRILDVRFDEVISKLRSCGVASAGMQNYFLDKRADLPTRVLINTPKTITFSSDSDPSKIVIVFAGSLYAQNEFLSLIAALNQLNWCLDGTPIELKVFSSSFNMPIHSGYKRTNLVFGGYMNEHDLNAELAKANVAYLPYWFAKEYADAVKRCFPAKLSTYIAGGCPVLYHGPEDSSPASFLVKYKVGTSVHGSSPNRIEKALRLLVLDQDFRNSYAAERQRALSEELGSDIFESRFIELIELALQK